MDKESLKKKRNEIEQQQKLMEQNFHRLAGAIALLNEQITELEKAEKEEPKKEE